MDTTAAGDAFAGALGVRWSETNCLTEAIRFANAAGAIAATRPAHNAHSPREKKSKKYSPVLQTHLPVTRTRNESVWGEEKGMTIQTPVESRIDSDRVFIHAISKRYGSITVLDNVSLSIKAGEVHGLLGANGAGKSTLCKILSGLTQPTAGQLFLDGKPIVVANKKDAELLGIEIVQQELNLIPTLTVGENLLLGNLPSTLGVISKRNYSSSQKTCSRKLDLIHCRRQHSFKILE